MTKGQLSRKADARQARVEDALALLGSVLFLLEHDTLRVHQAIRRTGLEELLGQVIDDHDRIACNIRAAQGRLREIWDDGQENRWEA
jgi:hypothetical protein